MAYGMCSYQPQFQSTRPHRGATIEVSRDNGRVVFQSTRPHRGATPDPDEYDEGHAEEWMEKHPYGWYNSESDYGTGDEEEHENGIEGDDDLQK